MGKRGVQLFDDKSDGFFSVCNFGTPWSVQDVYYHPGGLFASVGQMGMGLGVSPSPSNPRDDGGLKVPFAGLYVKYVEGFPNGGLKEVDGVVEKKKRGLKLKIKIANPSLRRLVSGAIAGAVSRTVVAPLETIRTHLMVGSSGHSTSEVFHDIMKTDGWTGLFRGNLVNVIPVAPSKAIEVLSALNLRMFFSLFCIYCCYRIDVIVFNSYLLISLNWIDMLEL